MQQIGVAAGSTPTLLEVGAGIGVASSAWQALGCSVLAAMDTDAAVCRGYRTLNPEVPKGRVYTCSAAAVRWAQVQALILAVSLHCQPFSSLPRLNQQGTGWDDVRSLGYHQLVNGLDSLPEELQPLSGYSENLVSWTWSKHEDALQSLRLSLEKNNYEVVVLATTSEAHGDGQTRWRSFLVFFKVSTGAMGRFLQDLPRVRHAQHVRGILEDKSNGAATLFIPPHLVKGNLRRERRRSLYVVTSCNYDGPASCVISAYGNTMSMPWGQYVDTSADGAADHALHLDCINKNSVRRLSVREVGKATGLPPQALERLTGDPIWYRWLGAAVTHGAITELLASMCRALQVPHKEVPATETKRSVDWEWVQQQSLHGMLFYKMMRV
jgi:site-specific DNA-cytosine methylase